MRRWGTRFQVLAAPEIGPPIPLARRLACLPVLPYLTVGYTVDQDVRRLRQPQARRPIALISNSVSVPGSGTTTVAVKMSSAKAISIALPAAKRIG